MAYLCDSLLVPTWAVLFLWFVAVGGWSLLGVSLLGMGRARPREPIAEIRSISSEALDEIERASEAYLEAVRRTTGNQTISKEA